jgi:hypothetical protein
MHIWKTLMYKMIRNMGLDRFSNNIGRESFVKGAKSRVMANPCGLHK